MRLLSIAWRLASRELRGGELGALIAALLVATAALTAVGAFAERVEGGLKASANELLGGDLVVASRYALDPAWQAEAASRGLQTATAAEFPTVVFAEDQSMLVQAKAVSQSYPLRGKLEVARSLDAPGESVASGPAPGTAWVDARVLSELGMRMGDIVAVGDVDLTVEKVIRLEPDRAGGLFALAPRVLFSENDLQSAGLLGEGSRARFSLLLAGTSTVVDEYRQWLSPRRGDAFFQTLEESQQQLSSALDRARRFLSLAALTAVLLSGVAIVIAVRQFVQRNLDTVAMLRCVGASQREILTLFTALLIFVGVPSLILGVGAGYAAQAGLIAAMGELIPESLPEAGVMPALAGLVTGITILLGFGIPPLIRLRSVSPIRVLSRQLAEENGRQWVTYLLPIAFAVALVFWQAQDVELASLMVGGIAGATIGLALAAWIAIALAARWRNAAGIGWRYGVANVARRRGASLLQVSGLGIGLTVLFLLGVVQSDLLRSWRSALPENAPNYFLINIQPDQVPALDENLQAAGAQYNGIFPMAVARIIQINDEDPNPDSRRARRRIDGTIRVSWAETLPPANRIVRGQWWTGQQQVSLAESWAESLNLDVGDTLTIGVGDTETTVTVANIREVEWDSFEVNFFVLMSPDSVQEFDATFLTSLYLPRSDFSRLSAAIRPFANISVIDVGTILDRVRTITERVSLTVRIVFLFTLAAGIVVLLAVLRAGLRARLFEGAVLRTLGGERRQLRRAVAAEFAVIGGIAGLLGAIASLIIGWQLAERAFGVDYQPSLWLIPAGTLGVGVAVAAIGLWGARRVLRTPPVVVFRQAQDV